MMPNERIEQTSQSAAETQTDDRLHKLFRSLLDEHHEHLQRVLDQYRCQQQVAFDERLASLHDLIDGRVQALGNDIAAEVNLHLSSELALLKSELQKSSGFNAEHMAELKDHITGVQTIDTEFWQTLQSEAIQQAHEISRATAEDIAQRTIDLFVTQQRSASSKIYALGLAASLGIFSVGVAWLSGLFG